MSLLVNWFFALCPLVKSLGLFNYDEIRKEDQGGSEFAS